MAGIKSTKEMIYDARSNKSGMIEIDVQGWTYNPSNKSYSVRVSDSAITTTERTTYDPITGEPKTEQVESKVYIAQKEVYYSGAQIDALFQGLGNNIDITESFTDELDSLISQALLLVTQQEPIYRLAEDGSISTAEDWILKTE